MTSDTIVCHSAKVGISQFQAEALPLQEQSQGLAHLARLLLQDHSCFLDLNPVGFAWCELPIEVDTLFNEGRVDANKVQHRWGQCVLFGDVPGKRYLCPPYVLFDQGSKVHPIDRVGEILSVHLEKIMRPLLIVGTKVVPEQEVKHRL